MNAAYTGFLSANRVKCRAYAKVPHLTRCPAKPLFMRVSRKKVKCRVKLSAKARTYRKPLIYKDILLSAEVPPIGVHEFRHLRRIHARSGAILPRPLTRLPMALTPSRIQSYTRCIPFFFTEANND